VLALNAFFVVLWTGSALLFLRASARPEALPTVYAPDSAEGDA